MGSIEEVHRLDEVDWPHADRQAEMLLHAEGGVELADTLSSRARTRQGDCQSGGRDCWIGAPESFHFAGNFHIEAES